MSYWTDFSASIDGLYSPEELERTAYRLMTEQVLYRADRSTSAAHRVVATYPSQFAKALEPLGVEVRINSESGFVYAYPRHEKSTSATKEQTLLALVLRFVYEECQRDGRTNDADEAAISIVELDEKYRLLTAGRDFPAKDMEDLMSTMKRWGIARKSDGRDAEFVQSDLDDQRYAVIVRPGILAVLGETALQRLAAFSATAAATAADQSTDFREDSEEGEKA
jgi:hypothetical protein